MMKFKRIFAIVAVILLAGLYVSALVFALIDNPVASDLLRLSFALTLVLPVFLYIYMWIYKKSKDRRDNRETGLIDEERLREAEKEKDND